MGANISNVRQPAAYGRFSARAALLLAVLLAWTPAGGQSWAEARRVGGPGSESVSAGVATPDGGMVWGGRYVQPWAYGGGGGLPPVFGQEDVLVAKLDAGLGVEWVATGGSALGDEMRALALDGTDGGVVAVGSFWVSAALGDSVVMAQGSPRALYVWKLSAQGHTEWARPLQGVGEVKAVTDVAVDAVGHIWVSGFFGGSLYLDADTLVAPPGTTHLFVAELDAEGHVLQSTHAGQTSDTRALRLALHPEGGCVVAGMFNGFTHLAGQTFRAETADRDGFVVRYGADLAPLWARKAGGVHDDDVTALAVDAEGHCYLAGFLVGVMGLGEGLSIQSVTGQPDAFLVKYAPDGTPLWGRTFGGPLRQQVSGLALRDGRPFLTGFYLGDIVADGQALPGSAALFRGFAAQFDTAGVLEWWLSMPGTGNVFPEVALTLADGRPAVWGGFEGTVWLGGGEGLVSAGGFDVFVGVLATGPTAVAGVSAPPPTLRVWPNPTRGLLHLHTDAPDYEATLHDAAGRLVARSQGTAQMDLSRLPPGMYVLRVRTWGLHQQVWHQRVVRH